MAAGGAPTTTEELRQRAQDDGIEFFFAQFVDMHGKPNAKLVPIQNFDSMMEEGAGFAGFAAGPMGQTPASPDVAAMPDPSSYTQVPFKPGLARLACNITVAGEPWPYCPRTILINAVERAPAAGLPAEDGHRAGVLPRQGARRADRAARRPRYARAALLRHEGPDPELRVHLDPLEYQNELGWGNYANDHEDANGQFESNFDYDDALITADRAIFFRYMVHAMAQERGHLATFMPKPFAHLTGNGCHLHMSLWDPAGDTNLFAADDDPRGLGLSTLAYSFLGGVIDHAEAVLAVGAPTVNSYKRIGVGAPHLGRDVVAGVRHLRHEQPHAGDPDPRPRPHRDPRDRRLGESVPGDRGVARRRPGRGREQREPGRAEHGEPLRAVRGRRRRARYQAAARHAARRRPHPEEDAVVQDWLGQGIGESYVDYFVKTKTAEFNEYHAGVSDWERKKYLTLF